MRKSLKKYQAIPRARRRLNLILPALPGAETPRRKTRGSLSTINDVELDVEFSNDIDGWGE